MNARIERTGGAGRPGPRTFPHRFAGATGGAYCVVACRSGTGEARSGRRTWGRTVWLAPRGSQDPTPLQSGLGSGGAIADSAAPSLPGRDGWSGRTAKYQGVELCLSLRPGAAGPEFRRSPLAPTLALGQPPGQLCVRFFVHSGHVSARSRVRQARRAAQTRLGFRTDNGATPPAAERCVVIRQWRPDRRLGNCSLARASQLLAKSSRVLAKSSLRLAQTSAPLARTLRDERGGVS